MGKSRTLASTVSTGGPLADGVIGISEVNGLQAALDAKQNDVLVDGLVKGDGLGGLTAAVPGVDYPALLSGTAITTNGAASYSFTGIPASAKNIRLMFRDVSTSTNAGIQLKIGTSSGLVTSGYTGNLLTVDSTTVSQTGALSDAFILTTIGPTLLFSGIIELAEIQSNIWVHTSQLGATGTRSHLGVGQLSLGAELTTLQILVGVGTFDGGTINILYE